MRYLTTVLLTCLIASPVNAQTFRAENRVDVVPTANGFAVQSGGGFWARGMWCAAADYARDRLGARGTDRVYIRTARTPGLGQRSAIEFTLDPAGLNPVAVVSVGASLRNAGANLSVDHAQTFCADRKLLSR